MKRRKIWSILALAALTGSLLAGCGEVKTEEQTKETCLLYTSDAADD